MFYRLVRLFIWNFEQKPVSTILTLPEDPIKEDFQTNASQKLQPVPTAWPKKAEKFFPIIIKAATEHEIDPFLIKAIIMAECGYNPKATSKKGATGLPFQIIVPFCGKFQK